MTGKTVGKAGPPVPQNGLESNRLVFMPDGSEPRERGFDKRNTFGRMKEGGSEGRRPLSGERGLSPSKPPPLHQRQSKSPGKAGGLKRGDRSKQFLLFAYVELQQLKLLHFPVFFFLILYAKPNFPLSHSYRAHETAFSPKTLSRYFKNFSKASRDSMALFPFRQPAFSDTLYLGGIDNSICT